MHMHPGYGFLSELGKTICQDWVGHPIAQGTHVFSYKVK